MTKNEARTPQNMFRFMPGRTQAAQDGKLLFPGLRYSRKAIEDTEKGFIAGVAIGPGQHMTKEDEGPGFKLTAGAKIVPAFPNESLETVPVRDFLVPKDKTGRAKQYIDFGTFQAMGPDAFRIVPYEEDKVMYAEVWTGDVDQGEGTYQLIQADRFSHGSVPFIGKDSLVIDAPSKEKGKKAKAKAETTEAEAEQGGVRAGKAELVGERKGLVVGGIPLWVARLWRIHYSSKDSEAILVRQLGKFYLVLIEDGKPAFREVPAIRYERHFDRLIGEELVAKATKSDSAAA